MATTFDLPASMVPQLASFGLQKSGGQFRGLFTTGVQSVDGNAERWVCSLTGTPKLRATAGAVEAFLNIMAGGVNKVRIYHPFRSQPLGTLRGSPTIGTTAAVEATSLVLANCYGSNLLPGASFELDTNVDNIANGWTLFVGGIGDGGRVYNNLHYNGSGVTQGTYCQYLEIVSAGNTNDSGIESGAVPVTAGRSYSFGIDALVNITAKVYALIRFFNGGGSQVGSDVTTSTVTATGVVERKTTTMTAPTGAVTARVLLRGINLPGEAMRFDGGYFGESASSDFVGPATLLMGDMIGSDGQLFQVAADCTANDMGAMTVPVVNRVTEEIASATAVTWYRPTVEFICPAMLNRSSFRPGSMDGAVIDLEQAR